jgi:hypothetical protein
MVTIVTPEHGAAFAEGWYNGDMAEAVSDTGIMTGPDGYYGDPIAEAAQLHYLDLEREICALVFEATKQVIAEAFVTAANEVPTITHHDPLLQTARQTRPLPRLTQMRTMDASFHRWRHAISRSARSLSLFEDAGAEKHVEFRNEYQTPLIFMRGLDALHAWG